MKYLEKEKSGKAILELQGVNGELFVYEDKVVLERKGPIAFITHGLKGTKTFLFMDITNVKFQEATPTENGYIRFDIINEDLFEGGILGATQDANTVMIKYSQNELTKDIKNYIEEQKKRLQEA